MTPDLDPLPDPNIPYALARCMEICKHHADDYIIIIKPKGDTHITRCWHTSDRNWAEGVVARLLREWEHRDLMEIEAEIDAENGS